jgi:hypothetical protein
MKLQALLLLPILALTATAAHAATLNVPLTGHTLAIDTPCAEHVDIQSDPSLHDQITVQATADHPEEIDRLVLSSGDTATIRTRQGGCWHTDIFVGHRTLALTIRVPAGFPLDIDEAGAGRYTIGSVNGPMKIDLSGAADLTIAQVTSLDVDISGAGNITLGQARGPAHIDMSGHGRIAIDHATIPSLDADMSGAGALTVAAGEITKAKIDDSGVGSIRLETTVTDAAVDISGAGSVHFAKLTGSLNKDISGVGAVTVGD